MPYTPKVFFNTLALLLSRLSTTLIGLLTVGILTRYLGVEGFGVYTTAFAYSSFLAVLADFGFYWVLIKTASQNKTDLTRVANNILTLRTFLALPIFLLGFLVSFFIGYPKVVTLAIGLTGFALFFQTINQTLIGIFQVKFQIYKAALTDILGRLLILGLVFIFSKINLPILWPFFAYSISNFFVLIINIWRVFPIVPLRPLFEKALWKKFIQEAWPMGLLTFLGLIYFKVDALMLGFFKGADSIDVGIYGASYKIVEVLSAIPSAYLGSAFPVLSLYIATHNQKLYPAFQRSFDFLVLLAVPIVGSIFLLARPIIQVVGGEEFISASSLTFYGQNLTAIPVLQILIWAVGLTFISNLFGYLVLSLGKQRELIFPNFILVLTNVGLNLLLIPRITYLGAAIATVLTESLVIFFTARVLLRHIDLRPNLSIFPKVLLSFLPVALLFIFLSKMTIWLILPVGFALYFISLFISKTITLADLKVLIGRAK